ncbi:MAG TPA: helix-turn-helix domain-containing protein [Chloroflexia bacterium]|nr:helix-turn-helix domain-containing protein [Chloroflexia bacterium]
MSSENNQLGILLKRFRLREHKSQEEVARASDIAHNYYGEIERGKREPGRDTLLNIARKGLELNLAETNLALVAAGFAPLPQVLTSNEIARLYKIVEAYLNKMFPYPAVLVSQFWGIIKWNSAFPVMLGTPLERIPAKQRNLLRLIFDPALPWRSNLLDWNEYACYQLALFKHGTLGQTSEPEYQALLADLVRLPGFSALWEETHPDMADISLGREWPIRLPLPLPLEGKVINCRLVLTRFDHFSQLSVQTYFPADHFTEEVFALVGQGISYR